MIQTYVSVIDNNGNITAVTPAGGVTAHLIDSAGNAVDDGAGHLKERIFDAAGNSADITPVSNALHVQLYAAGGNAIATTATFQVETALFDSAGNAVATQDLTGFGAGHVLKTYPLGSNALPFSQNGLGNAVVTQQGNGASTKGTVDGTGTQKVVEAASILGVERTWLTVQNTDAANDLYLSFTSPATVNDIKIQAGGSITFNTGPNNALYGLSSAASTKFAAMAVEAA